MAFIRIYDKRVGTTGVKKNGWWKYQELEKGYEVVLKKEKLAEDFVENYKLKDLGKIIQKK